MDVKDQVQYYLGKFEDMGMSEEMAVLCVKYMIEEMLENGVAYQSHWKQALDEVKKIL